MTRWQIFALVFLASWLGYLLAGVSADETVAKIVGASWALLLQWAWGCKWKDEPKDSE